MIIIVFEVLVPAGMDDVAIFTELGRFMLIRIMVPYGCLVIREKVLHESFSSKHIWKSYVTRYVGLDANDLLKKSEN